MMERFCLEPRRKELHQQTKEKFQELYDDIQYILGKNVSVAKPVANSNKEKIIFFKDIKSLPDDLIREVNLFDRKPEGVIFNIISKMGEADLDSLLIEYYKQTGQVMKREDMIAKIHRISKKDMIEHASGKRGRYKVKVS
jgi:hypothetical protein